MLKKGHQRRSQSLSLLTYWSTLRGLRSLGPCWMAFLSILLFFMTVLALLSL
jgi:hypothetical protein